MRFPSDFVWGTATASYQVEGAVADGGRVPSVWDMLCRKEGAIWQGQNGDTACDHYHRFREDVGLMKQLGLKAYRFSIAWPRVMPDGTGKANPKGLAFYDQLVDALVEAGITPYVTLFHWDYPYELYCRGGWLNADSPDWFADYTRVVVDRLSDRVQHWLTLNEPQCFVGLGHRDGVHAPGDKLGWTEVLRAAHHALLAHGKSVQAIRANARSKPEVGFAPIGTVAMPASDQPADIEAARFATLSILRKDLWNNTWFSDPVFKKCYPSDGLAMFGDAVPVIGANDMDIIGQPLDFYACNIYQAVTVRAGDDGKPVLVDRADGYPITAFQWAVVPDCLYWGPRFLWERYQKPIMITENGLSGLDWVSRDGAVHDPQRIDYTARHLEAFGRAGAEGVEIKGYFHWSLLDNFEWAEGYKHRFGLIHVDYETQKRTMKDSAHWYREVIASNGAKL